MASKKDVNNQRVSHAAINGDILGTFIIMCGLIHDILHALISNVSKLVEIDLDKKESTEDIDLKTPQVDR